MRFFLIYLLLAITSCSSAQVNNSCQVFLEPFDLNNISLFQEKKEFLKQFDSYQKDNKSKISDENIDYYKITKGGNEYLSNSIYGIVGFYNSQLVFININIEFVPGYNKVEKITSLIKKTDSELINDFLYSSKNKYTARSNVENCNRRIVFMKNKNGLIEMNVFIGRG